MVRVRLRQGVYCTTKNDESVLIDSATGQFFALNATGTQIMRAFDEGQIEGLVKDWSERFALPESEIQGDVDGFCKELAEQGLVETDESDSTSSVG